MFKCSRRIVSQSLLPLAALFAASATWAACDATTPVTLTLSGSAQKQAGDALSLDYCLFSNANADLYAALSLPDNSLLFLGATGSFSAKPTPFKSASKSVTGNLLKLDALPAATPLGKYGFYAVAVPAGADVLNAGNWLGKVLANSNVTVTAKATQSSAFFYQTVAPSASVTKAGVTSDGANVSTYGVSLVNAKLGTLSYGDPTFSRLANGRWAMSAWTSPEDTRGFGLLYHEASCPQVVDANVRSLVASTATGCNSKASPAQAKTSQIFAVDGSNYIFTMVGGEIYLNRLTDATHTAADLKSICIRQTAAKSFAELLWGESTLVLSKTFSGGLLLSDSGIARRKDGTWVLFVKGIASSTNTGCTSGGLCELCARAIYRTTSTDLINWSALEKVVSQASVPDAVTYPDGTVWLYYQNFANTCSTQNIKLAERAPISAVYEDSNNAMTGSATAKFSNETFESNTTEHYPTNGNPIALPDAAARTALDTCMGTTAK